MVSRRTALRLGGLGLVGLAGCTDRSPGETGSPGTESPSDTRSPTDDSTPDTRSPGSETDPDAETSVEGGRVVWKRSFETELRSGPVLADGVVVAQIGTSVRGFDTATGSESWRVEIPLATEGVDRPTGTMTVDDGTVYAVVGRSFGTGAADFVVAAIGPDGTERWRAATGVGGFHTLVGVGDGAVVIATGDDAVAPAPRHPVVALETTDGARRWQAEAGDASGGAVGDETALVEAFGAVYGFDLADGAERLRFQPTDADVADTAVGGGRAFVGLERFEGPNDAISLVAFDAAGDRRWETAAGPVTSLRYREGLYVGGRRIRRVDSDGSRRWTADVGGLVSDVPFDERSLYVTDGSRLAAVTRAGGSVRWTASVPESTLARTTGGGAVYSLNDRRGVAFAHHRASGDQLWRANLAGDGLDPVADDTGAFLATDRSLLKVADD